MATKIPPGESKKATRQRLMIEFIEAYTRENGIPPTLREIAPAIGLSEKSFGTVQIYAQELIAQGKLRKIKGRSTLMLAGDPR